MVKTIKVSDFPTKSAVPGDLLTGLDAGANTNFLESDLVFSPLPFIIVTTLTEQMAPNKGYISNNAGRIVMTLPLLFNTSDVIVVGAFSTGGWQIAQNAGQQILFGNELTTAGIGGSLTSTAIGDFVYLVGVVANTSLMLMGVQGNITII